MLKDPRTDPKLATSIKKGHEKASAELKAASRFWIVFWVIFWPVFWTAAAGVKHFHPAGVLPQGAQQDIAAPDTMRPIELTGYFNDGADLFHSQAISGDYDETLHNFEKETSTQIAVVIYPNVPVGSVEDFTIRTAELSRLGKKGRDNGAILFIFMGERAARLEVGYGLEGVLTDIASFHILNQKLAPRFARGEYQEGINDSLAAIMSRVRGEYRNDRTPGGYRLLYRKVKVAVPIMLKQAWYTIGLVMCPAITDLTWRGRLTVSFFGTIFGTPFLAMIKGFVRLLWIRVIKRKRLRGSDGKLGEDVRDDIFSMSQLLWMLGFFGVVAVGIVLVAGGGAFGGGGALIHW